MRNPDLERIGRELFDLRTDSLAREHRAQEAQFAAEEERDLLIEAVRRTCYDLGLEYVATFEDAVERLIEIAKTCKVEP